MKLSLIDRALHKDNFIGRRYVKATRQKRDQLIRFREQFNKKSIEERVRVAQEMSGKASIQIEDDLGYKVIQDPPFDEIGPMVQETVDIVTQNDVNELRGNSKAQLLTQILKKDRLSLDSPYVKFILREDIMASIANYLGMIPVITKIDIWYSQATPELSNSQLHHCDFESKRQLKLFVYATDVTMESGPLTVIDAKTSEMLGDKIDYRFGQKIPDDVVDPIVPQDQQVVALGKKGTMIFADTSRCFHYGSRVGQESTPRIAVLYQFLRPQSFALPLKFINNSPYSFLATPDMPKYQRLALGVE